jgi:hypothetical protein
MRRWIGFSEDDAKGIAEGTKYQATRPQSSSQRVERKAPWEPRSFTEDNAFHRFAEKSGFNVVTKTLAE